MTKDYSTVAREPVLQTILLRNAEIRSLMQRGGFSPELNQETIRIQGEAEKARKLNIDARQTVIDAINAAIAGITSLKGNK